MSITKGTELWDEVMANGAEPVNWHDLSPEKQVAATRAGTVLWNEVAGHINETPEVP